MEKVQGYVLYRIYYGNTIIYLGRTKQPLQSRIRGHLVSAPMHRSIDIEQVTKIEYAEFPSEADMNLYEIYFINLWKPALNVDDKCRDEMTVRLPDVEWKNYPIVGSAIWEKWRASIVSKDGGLAYKRSERSRLMEQLHIIRRNHTCGDLSDEAYETLRNAIKERLEELEKQEPSWF